MDFAGKRAVIGADGLVSAVDLTQDDIAQRAADDATFQAKVLEGDAARTREATFTADVDRVDLLDKLKNATAAQTDAYVDNNVTNLADAKRMLKHIIKILALNIQR